MKVTKKISIVGFVALFFGLSSMMSTIKPENNLQYIDDDYPANTSIHFEHFDVLMSDYQVQNDTLQLKAVNGDTVELMEWIGQDWSRGKIKISSENKQDRFVVSYALTECIYEIYNPANFDIDSALYGDRESQSYRNAVEKLRSKEEVWYQNRAYWSQISSYKNAKKLGYNFFKIPPLDYSGMENKRKKIMHLRDTLVEVKGEYTNYATLVYQEKPCTYFLESAYIKIKHYRDEKLMEVKIIKVNFAYGC